MSHCIIKPRRISLSDALHLGVISRDCFVLIFDVGNSSSHKFLESVCNIYTVLREVGCSLHHCNKIGKRIERYELTPQLVPRERFIV